MTATGKRDWGHAALAEVATIERRALSPSEIRDGTLYVGLEHMDSSGGFLDVAPVQAGDLASTKFQFTPGHILYGKLRPYLAKIARPTFSGVCSTDILPIAPGPSINKDFLYYYLRQPQMIDLATAQCSGANLPRLSPRHLAEFQIPLPPLSEQKRIAAILDQADAIRRKRRQAIQNVADIAPAVFSAMFPHQDTEPTAPLSSLGVEFRYGTSNKSEPNGFPTLRIPNVLAAALDLTDLKNVPVDQAEFERLKLRDGDLLFVRTNGNPDYVGRCAVFDSRLVSAGGYDPEQFIYASYLIRGRVDPRVLNPRYLRAFLDTPRGRRMVRERCRTSAGQYNINTHGLGSLAVARPPIQRQDQFAQCLEEIDSLQQKTVAGYVEAGKLFDSLVHRAFRGDL